MLHQIMLKTFVWCLQQPSRVDLINKLSPDLRRTERSCTPNKAGNISSMMWVRGWGQQYYWFYYSAASHKLRVFRTLFYQNVVEMFESLHIKPPEQTHLPKLLVYEVGSFRNAFSELMWRTTLRVKPGGLLAMGSSTKPCAICFFPDTVCTDQQRYVIGSEVQAGFIQHNTSLNA